MRRRGGGAVGSTDAGVVLGATPGETDARVADRITLHLVDGHLGRVAVDKLNKTASLAGRDLNVGNFTETLEEGAELILSDVARETADEDSCVVGVGKLVHGLHRVETGVVRLGGNSPLKVGRVSGDRGHHGVGGMGCMSAVLMSSAKKC